RGGRSHTMFSNAYRSVTCERPPRPCPIPERILFLDGTATPPFQGGKSICLNWGLSRIGQHARQPGVVPFWRTSRVRAQESFALTGLRSSQKKAPGLRPGATLCLRSAAAQSGQALKLTAEWMENYE